MNDSKSENGFSHSKDSGEMTSVDGIVALKAVKFLHKFSSILLYMSTHIKTTTVLHSGTEGGGIPLLHTVGIVPTS